MEEGEKGKKQTLEETRKMNIGNYTLGIYCDENDNAHLTSHRSAMSVNSPPATFNEPTTIIARVVIREYTLK